MFYPEYCMFLIYVVNLTQNSEEKLFIKAISS
jgi:hypothetical protein